MDELYLCNIETRVHYVSLSRHSFYQKEYGVKTDDVSISEEVGGTTFSPPLSAGLIDEDMQNVVKAVWGVQENQV